jgi:hypothetical protein
MSFHAGDMFELATTTQQPVMEMLSLFPSAEAIKRGDKDYHKAVNIAAEMHARCDDPPITLRGAPRSTGACCVQSRIIAKVNKQQVLSCDFSGSRYAHWQQGGW